MCSSRAAEGNVSSQPQWQLDWSAAWMSSKAQTWSCHQSLPRVLLLPPACRSPNRIFCYYFQAPELGRNSIQKESPLRRNEAAFFSLVLGMLANARMRKRRGKALVTLEATVRTGQGSRHLPHPWAQRPAVVSRLCLPPIDTFWTRLTIERRKNRCLLSWRTPTRRWRDKGNNGDKALEHSIQETRIAWVITPVPHCMNALCREKKHSCVIMIVRMKM